MDEIEWKIARSKNFSSQLEILEILETLQTQAVQN